MTAERTDDDWLTALRARDESALRDLEQLLRRGLRRALARRGKVREEDVEDFAQDAILRVLDNLESFAGRSRFTTWAHGIAVNVALTELRRRRWRDVSLDAGDGGDDRKADPVATVTDPGDSVALTEILDILRDALRDDLTDRQRTAITMLLEGAPFVAIADRLGMNLNALYKLAHDARLRIKHTFASAGFEDRDITSRLAAARAS